MDHTDLSVSAEHCHRPATLRVRAESMTQPQPVRHKNL